MWVFWCLCLCSSWMDKFLSINPMMFWNLVFLLNSTMKQMQSKYNDSNIVATATIMFNPHSTMSVCQANITEIAESAWRKLGHLSRISKYFALTLTSHFLKKTIADLLFTPCEIVLAPQPFSNQGFHAHTYMHAHTDSNSSISKTLLPLTNHWCIVILFVIYGAFHSSGAGEEQRQRSLMFVPFLYTILTLFLCNKGEEMNAGRSDVLF